MTKPLSGRVSRGNAGSNSTAQPPAEKESTVRGVPQSVIDSLRWTRGHKAANKLTEQTIQEDYARVGINISLEEAKKIREAVFKYSKDNYSEMIDAWEKRKEWKTLTQPEQDWLKEYDLVGEYTRVALL